nr:unnamed protein product [Callosobruchus analis]
MHREEPVVDIIFDSGLLLSLRRRVLKSIMLNTYHPCAIIYFRSHLQRRREHIRHLTVSPYTVHPFSYFNLYWESMISILYCISCTLYVVNCMYSWNSTTQVALTRPLVSIESVYIFDSILRFFVGYYDPELNKTVLRRTDIAKHYLKGYFLVDQLPCFVTYLYPLRSCKSHICSEIVKWSRLLALTRLFRIPRIIETYDIIKFKLLPNYHGTIIKTSLVLYITLVISYAIVLAIENFFEYTYYGTKRWKMFNVFRLYTITLKLLTVGYTGTVEAGQVAMQIASLISLTWGCYVSMVALIWTMRLWTYHSHTRLGADYLYREFQHYVQYEELPHHLRSKCFKLFNFKFHTYYYEERTIDKTVSLTLKQQIQITITRRQLEKVDFFRDVPSSILTKLFSKCKSEIFLTNDVIVVAGSPGQFMYFINFGTVAVYSTSGREICHLEDGAHIGEIAFIFDEMHQTTVVAVAPCELFKLKKADYDKVLNRHPDVKELIQKRATQRWNEYKKKSQ